MTMLGIFTVIFVAAPAVMFGTDNGTVQVLLWMILFLLLVVCSYLPYWVANARVKALKAEHHYMDGCSIPQIDEQWRHGIFYYNPGDTRLNGEKNRSRNLYQPCKTNGKIPERVSRESYPLCYWCLEYI